MLTADLYQIRVCVYIDQGTSSTINDNNYPCVRGISRFSTHTIVTRSSFTLSIIIPHSQPPSSALSKTGPAPALRTGVCEKNTPTEKRFCGKTSFRSTQLQGVQSSFCCKIARQRLAQKDCFFTDTSMMLEQRKQTRTCTFS